MSLVRQRAVRGGRIDSRQANPTHTFTEDGLYRALSAVFVAEYTDEGSGNLPPLTDSDEVVLEPTP